MKESKFKVGDRVKIVNTEKTCSHLNGTYGTISDLFLSSDGNYYYKLDNLSFESRKGKHTCFYAFIDSELELATTKRQKEPKKEAFGFKHGDLVKSADLPSCVTNEDTICRVVGYVRSLLIIEIPNCTQSHDGKLYGEEMRWEHFSGNKYWYAFPEELTLIKPSEISQTIVSHEIIGNKTYVTLSNGNKGIARCNPEDKFDAYIGLKLATERAYGVEIAVKPTQQKEYRSIASYLKPDNYAKEVCYPSEKAKFKKGDYVFVRNATHGCQGANGRRCIVTDRQATNGLTNDPSIDTTNVLLENGEVWRVNTDGLEHIGFKF